MVLLLISAIGVFIQIAKNRFVIWKGEGAELTPKRKEKLQKELLALQNAEQYALIVRRADWYPCYQCKDDAVVFLTQGEVWKYGVTRRGQPGRYPEGLPFSGLLYVVQFQGTWQECLAEKIRKSQAYGLLPENLKRKHPLLFPPGNKRDY